MKEKVEIHEKKQQDFAEDEDRKEKKDANSADSEEQSAEKRASEQNDESREKPDESEPREEVTVDSSEEADAENKDGDAQPDEEDVMMRFLRLQADFQNFRKRAEKEKADTVRYANERLVIQLLEVTDNFERALASEKEHDSFFDGIQMIYDQLQGVLERNGLEAVVADGEKFDPNLHHAVLMEESDEVEADHVIETFQKGYRLNGKLIRPAMVKVAK